MRKFSLGLVIALGLVATSFKAHAQIPFGNINDPFFAYYSFYLPRQQAQALQPGPEATINAVTANRQQYAATNRNGMFDPFAGGQGNGGFDPLDDFSSSPSARKFTRSLSNLGGRYGVHGGNLNGLGPQGYYSGKLNSYYRELRTGRGRNANLAVTKNRGFSGGFGGIGNVGLPGPR